MKKKILTLLLALALITAASVGCTSKKPAEDTDVSSGAITSDSDNAEDTENTDETEKEQPTDGSENGEDAEPSDTSDTSVENGSEELPEQPEVPSPGTPLPESPAKPEQKPQPEQPTKPEQPATPDESADTQTPGTEKVDLSAMTLAEIVDAIYEKKPVGLRLMTSEIDLTNADMLSYNTGLDSADKVKEAVVSETMIGSQAYSLVLVRVKDSADASDVASAMKKGINTSKWICVTADDLKVSAYGDLVLLCMVDSQYADTVTASEIMDAFKALCGGTLSAEL